MRAAIAATTAVLLLGCPALAQQEPAPAAAQPEQALKNDEAVKQSQDPQPVPTGERSPKPFPTPTGTPELHDALLKVWNTAVDLDGNPLPGPSALAVPEAQGKP